MAKKGCGICIDIITLCTYTQKHTRTCWGLVARRQKRRNSLEPFTLIRDQRINIHCAKIFYAFITSPSLLLRFEEYKIWQRELTSNTHHIKTILVRERRWIFKPYLKASIGPLKSLKSKGFLNLKPCMAAWNIDDYILHARGAYKN